MLFNAFVAIALGPLFTVAAPLIIETVTTTQVIVVQPTENTTVLVTKTVVPTPTITPASITTPISTIIPATEATPTADAAVTSDKKLVMAYYPDWAGESFPPEKIDFTRFDWIDFAFALPDKDFGITWDDTNSAPKLLRRLVVAAHAAGKKVKLSVGGWTGSKYFSPAVATPESRLIFVNNILTTYIKYDIDGIDIDWEYPGQPGNPGNIVDTEHDTANYLLFLQLLRRTLPPSAKITAATLTQPWVDASGQPSKDISAFAAVLDWVLLMNYDVWGSSANPGPNAPLSDGCGNSTQPGASADAAVRAWTAAGFPPNKLTLGLPSYGYVSKSRAVLLHGRTVALTNEDGSIGDGQIQFRELIHQGALVMGEDEDGTQRHIGTGGYTRHWDECSSTPFLRSAVAGRIITYDDPKSIAMKADLARQQGLLGVNMFDVHGDTDEWHLIDAARNALLKN